MIIKTRHTDGKVVATANVDGKRRQATVTGPHTNDTHVDAAHVLGKRLGVSEVAHSVKSATRVDKGFDFEIVTR